MFSYGRGVRLLVLSRQRPLASVASPRIAWPHLTSWHASRVVARTLPSSLKSRFYGHLIDLRTNWISFQLRYRFLNQTRPFAMAFGLCFTKGVIADLVAQKCVERCEKVDGRRLLAVALFSGCFTGCAYHFIFNVTFPRIFGLSKSLATVSMKALADASLIFPFLYMPIFYSFDEFFRHGTISSVPSRWFNDVSSCLQEYAKIWPATMLCVFSVVPPDLRVSFIAGVSFMWLILLSVLSH